ISPLLRRGRLNHCFDPHSQRSLDALATDASGWEGAIGAKLRLDIAAYSPTRLPSVNLAPVRGEPLRLFEAFHDRLFGSTRTCIRYRGARFRGLPGDRQACGRDDDTDAGPGVAPDRASQRGFRSGDVVAGTRVIPPLAAPPESVPSCRFLHAGRR